MDTRTARTPTGRNSRGFYDTEPGLNTVKVPSDPAQVVVNHASFRVEFSGPPSGSGGVSAEADTIPALSVPQRREPVLGGRFQSQRPLPGEVTARWLSPATARRAQESDGTSTTQIMPRITAGPDGRPLGADTDSTVVAPGVPQRKRVRVVVRPRAGGLAAAIPPTPSGPRPEDVAPQEDAERTGGTSVTRHAPPDEGEAGGAERARRGGDTIRQAYYPGRRMNLGVVLLPLRIFLGFVSIYAGMGKLTNPVFFDGGERGSMVSWLRSLEPWSAATPLHEFAISHPVGSGLTVAFLHIIVGVLTIFGLWQRLVAAVGMLLSVALIVTVSWRAAPVYDAPDIIYLAAWSPLVIAGAPVYSLDGRLAGEAWRRLGPRSALWDLRRRVLRKGVTIATVLVGLALLIGSLLGGAVRSAQVTTVRTPEHPPTNQRLGSPLPQPPGGPSGRATHYPGPRPPAPRHTVSERGTSPSASPDEATGRASSRPSTSTPHGEQPIPTPQVPVPPAPRLPDASAPGKDRDDEDGGRSGDKGEAGREKEERGALGGLLG